MTNIKNEMRKHNRRQTHANVLRKKVTKPPQGEWLPWEEVPSNAAKLTKAKGRKAKRGVRSKSTGTAPDDASASNGLVDLEESDIVDHEGEDATGCVSHYFAFECIQCFMLAERCFSLRFRLREERPPSIPGSS